MAGQVCWGVCVVVVLMIMMMVMRIGGSIVLDMIQNRLQDQYCAAVAVAFVALAALVVVVPIQPMIFPIPVTCAIGY